MLRSPFFQADLYKHLEFHFQETNISNISAIASVVDKVVLSYLRDHYEEHIATYIPGAEWVDSPDTFFSKGRLFKFRAMECSEDLETLEISVLDSSGQSKPEIENIQKAGRFKKIRLVYSPEIPLNIPLIIETAARHFMTAYDWMVSKLNKVIEGVEKSLADSLYKIVRAEMPGNAQHLLKSFLFVSVTKERCIYLLDEQAYHAAMDTSESTKYQLGYNPVTLVSELLTFNISYELVASTAAIKQSRPLFVEVNKSKYIDGKGLSAQAETVFYNGNDVYIYPIGRGHDSFLVCCYAAELSEEILPYLESSKAQLSSQFQTSQNLLLKTYSDLVQEKAYQAMTKGVLGWIKTVLKHLLLEPNFFGLGIKLGTILSSIVEHIEKKKNIHDGKKILLTDLMEGPPRDEEGHIEKSEELVGQSGADHRVKSPPARDS